MWPPDSVTDTSNLLLVITRTEFISAHVITNECRHYRRGLTTSLQEEAKDRVQAVSEIRTLTSSLKKVRENVVSYHSRWFETVSKMCNEVETTSSIPRIYGHRSHRASQTYQSLISLNTTKELSQFQFWTIFSLRLTSGLVHTKNTIHGLHLLPSVFVTEDLAIASR